MSEDLKQWMIKVIKELQKHADRDDCYACKYLLKASFLQAVMKVEE